MRAAAAGLLETPTTIITLAVVVGIGFGIGAAGVMELRSLLFPWKPSGELCEAAGYKKGE